MKALVSSLALSMVLTFTSCQQLMQTITNKPDINTTTSKVKDTSTVSCSELSQSLVAGPFKANTNPNELEADTNNLFKISYEIDNNPDNNHVKDTDIVVTSGQSEIRFLKTGKETILYKAAIFKNTSVLESNCKIGMHRLDFIRQNHLQIPDSCNAIMVLSHNEALMVTVLFRSDTINTIMAQTLGE